MKSFRQAFNLHGMEKTEMARFSIMKLTDNAAELVRTASGSA
jgi:hypothetical protein